MKFLLTDELGRLSKWLRILGFDTVVEKDKRALVLRSLREDRVVLTRDSKMSRFTGTRMVKVNSDFVEKQLAQVIHELGLKINKGDLFKLCIICDEELVPAEKASVKELVPPYVYQTQENFMRCPKCSRIYWQGSHWELVNKFLQELQSD
ncbi:MAG: Mut7-C RNAse domain-containing protein [Candidatus Omnitrophica bacterium]|nr:Mut7-C RNAse domain-containing protein [Candidatus Omnitrophota bacterium]